jgi:proteasome accessory factor A
MDPRGFWLSTEYSIVCVVAGRALPRAQAWRQVLGPVMAPGVGSTVRLRNGGLLRLDAAGRLEYETPDCASVADLIVRDKAGERLLDGLAVDAGERMRDAGGGDVRVFKRAEQDRGGVGCQENYRVGLAGPTGSFARTADILLPFLITRQLVCGVGAVVQTPAGVLFCLSRAGDPSAAPPPGIGGRGRPRISVRTEARAVASVVRLQVDDPAMSETSALLKMGTTDLVLRMAKAGAAPPALAVYRPAEAIGAVSRDITGRRPVRLADGREVRPLDIQRAYLGAAKEFTGRLGGADAVTARVLGLWERALDAIEAGNLDAIAREIDWVIKYRLLEGYLAAGDLSSPARELAAPELAAEGLAPADVARAEVAAADLAYHDINRGSGVFYQLQRDGKVERTARDIEIFAAKTMPPQPVRFRRAG